MEVECKVRLDTAEVERLLGEFADSDITLSQPQQQRDVYFKERGFRNQVQGPGSYLVRVRYSDSRTMLNMKRLTEEDGVWEEVETGIQDGAVAEEIITSIGAEHAVTVTKVRRMTRLANLEIIIDDVAELGTYLELAIETDGDTANARKTINEFLAKLSIEEDRVELRGYPTILLERQGVAFSAK